MSIEKILLDEAAHMADSLGFRQWGVNCSAFLIGGQQSRSDGPQTYSRPSKAAEAQIGGLGRICPFPAMGDVYRSTACGNRKRSDPNFHSCSKFLVWPLPLLHTEGPGRYGLRLPNSSVRVRVRFAIEAFYRLFGPTRLPGAILARRPNALSPP